jgi:hypothetical protein
MGSILAPVAIAHIMPRDGFEAGMFGIFSLESLQLLVRLIHAESSLPSSDEVRTPKKIPSRVIEDTRKGADIKLEFQDGHLVYIQAREGHVIPAEVKARLT